MVLRRRWWSVFCLLLAAASVSGAHRTVSLRRRRSADDNQPQQGDSADTASGNVSAEEKEPLQQQRRPLKADLPLLQWRQKTHIVKCCDDRSALVRQQDSADLTCEPVPPALRWRPLLLDAHAGEVAPPGPLMSIQAGNISCEAPLVLDAGADPADEFQLLTTGHLYLRRADALMPPETFCADRVVTLPSAGGTPLSAPGSDPVSTAAQQSAAESDPVSTETQKSNAAFNTDDVTLAARVCLVSLHQKSSVLDPESLRPACVRGTCLRKCCPRGMKVERETQQCLLQTGATPWQPVFHHDLTQPLERVPYTTVDGNAICKVKNGSFGKVMALEPAYYDDEQFYLQEDGRLWVPDQLITMELTDFCVDQVEYFYKNQTIDYHFAILCFGDQPDRALVGEIYRALLVISTLFLFVTFVVYAATPELRNLHGRCLLSHVSALTTAYVCLIVAQTEGAYVNEGGCLATAIIMYFSFIAACFWLNVMSFDIWLTFSRIRSAAPNSSKHRRFIRYSAFCWGGALLLTALLAMMQFAPVTLLPPQQVIRPRLGERSCWFSGGVPMLVYFHTPILVLMLANLVFFLLTARNLLRSERDTRMAARKKRGAERFKIYVNLFIVMGITWIAEAVSKHLGPKEIWFVTDVINALQGFFIFLLFTARANTRRAVRRRLASSPLGRWCRWCRCCDLALTPAGQSQKTGSSSAPNSSQRQSGGEPMRRVGTQSNSSGERSTE